jgi:dGTP triphosphohydrolase
MKEIDAKFVEIDSAIVRVIRSYKEADAILDAKIDTLAAKTQAALELKLDKTTFQAYVAEMEAKLKTITANVSMLLSRVQSLVYVPEYDDNRITFNWAVVQPEEKAAPAEGGNVTGNAVDAPSANLNDETKGDSPVIVVPSEVKYRIYGEDAADVVMSLVDLVNAAAYGYERVLRTHPDHLDSRTTDADVARMARGRGIADFVSGLTDAQAVAFAARLAGGSGVLWTSAL